MDLLDLDTNGFGGSGRAIYICTGCVSLKTFNLTSSIKNEQQGKPRNYVGTIIVVSFLMAGMTYQQYMEAMIASGIDYFTPQQFFNIVKWLHHIVEELTEESCEKWRVKMVEDGSSTISADGTYGKRGYDSNNTTVHVLDLAKQKVQ